MELQGKQLKPNLTSTELSRFIVDCILEKKGKDPVLMDMRQLPEAFCDYFVICHGTSTTHAKGVAGFVEVETKKQVNELPISVEGTKNAEWVLIDYGSVVVHIFLKDKRAFYQLEDLWSDAKVTAFSEEGDVIV